MWKFVAPGRPHKRRSQPDEQRSDANEHPNGRHSPPTRSDHGDPSAAGSVMSPHNSEYDSLGTLWQQHAEREKRAREKAEAEVERLKKQLAEHVRTIEQLRLELAEARSSARSRREMQRDDKVLGGFLNQAIGVGRSPSLSLRDTEPDIGRWLDSGRWTDSARSVPRPARADEQPRTPALDMLRSVQTSVRAFAVGKKPKERWDKLVEGVLALKAEDVARVPASAVLPYITQLFNAVANPRSSSSSSVGNSDMLLDDLDFAIANIRTELDQRPVGASAAARSPAPSPVPSQHLPGTPQSALRSQSGLRHSGGEERWGDVLAASGGGDNLPDSPHKGQDARLESIKSLANQTRAQLREELPKVWEGNEEDEEQRHGVHKNLEPAHAALPSSFKGHALANVEDPSVLQRFRTWVRLDSRVYQFEQEQEERNQHQHQPEPSGLPPLDPEELQAIIDNIAPSAGEDVEAYVKASWSDKVKKLEDHLRKVPQNQKLADGLRDLVEAKEHASTFNDWERVHEKLRELEKMRKADPESLLLVSPERNNQPPLSPSTIQNDAPKSPSVNSARSRGSVSGRPARRQFSLAWSHASLGSWETGSGVGSAPGSPMGRARATTPKLQKRASHERNLLRKQLLIKRTLQHQAPENPVTTILERMQQDRSDPVAQIRNCEDLNLYLATPQGLSDFEQADLLGVLVDVLETHIGSDEAVSVCLQGLVLVLALPRVRDDFAAMHHVATLRNVLEEWQMSSELATLAFRAFALATEHREVAQWCIAPDADSELEPLLKLACQMVVDSPLSYELHVEAFRTTANLCTWSPDSAVAVAGVMARAVATTLRACHMAVVDNALATAAVAAKSPVACAALVHEGVCQLVMACMVKYPASASVQRAGCEALGELTCASTGLAELERLDALTVVAQAVELHPGSLSILPSACVACQRIPSAVGDTRCRMADALEAAEHNLVARGQHALAHVVRDARLALDIREEDNLALS